MPFVLPGVLVVWLSFDAGGFFARDTAAAAVVVGICLGVRLLVSDRPLGGLGVLAGAGAVLLVLLGAWTLLSSRWSDAEGRALFEATRVLLYLLIFVLLASVPRTTEGARWLVRSWASGVLAVGLVAFITRALPEVWPTTPDIVGDRLSYPLTYWNALGLLCTTGIILAFALTADLREHRIVRIAAAGALPVLGAALTLTFSRASIGLAIVGIAAIAALVRTRGAVSALAVLPASAVAVAAAWSADLLSSTTPTTPAAVEQGHQVSVIVALSVVAAMAIRWALTLEFDRRRVRRARARDTRPFVLAGAGAVVLVLVVGLAAGGASEIGRQYDRFVQGSVVETEEGAVRERLVDPGNNGRLVQWRAARRGWDRHVLQGTGAGTFRLVWDLERQQEYQLEDAHSLYLEMGTELGIVGLALVLAVIALVLVGLGLRARGPGRGPYAALLVAAAAWALHAGIDWDWEMPAVTLGFFAAGGAALAAPASDVRRAALPLIARVGMVVLLAGVLVTPVLVIASERSARLAKQAFERRDCATATRKAQSAVEHLAVRAEPFELLAYCAIRAGRYDAGLAQMREAVERDPHNWRVHYGLALATAAAGRDPRASIKMARRLNPLDPLAFTASKSFWETSEPRSWRKRALSARLPRN